MGPGQRGGAQLSIHEPPACPALGPASWDGVSEQGGGEGDPGPASVCLGRPDPPCRAKGSPGMSQGSRLSTQASGEGAAMETGSQKESSQRTLAPRLQWSPGLWFSRPLTATPSLQVLVWQGARRPGGLHLPGPHHPRALGRSSVGSGTGLGTRRTAEDPPSRDAGEGQGLDRPPRTQSVCTTPLPGIPLPALPSSRSMP